jgi:ribbon-helix-helix CopG family protein
MERTQISLTSEQAARLRRIAAKRGTSMSALIRDAVERAMPDVDSPTIEERWERAFAAIGTARGGGGNVSEDHDRYLADAYEDWRQK